MDTIAKASGVSHGAIFVHFNSKENLVEKIIAQFFDKWMVTLQQTNIEDLDFEYLYDWYFDFVEKEYRGFVMLVREINDLPPKLRESIWDKEQQIRTLMQQAYEHGVKAGKYRKIDSKMLDVMLFGAIHQFLRFPKLFDPDGRALLNRRQSLKKAIFTLLEKQGSDPR